jgi:hypothetical protein
LSPTDDTTPQKDSDFVKQWTKIVLVLAITLATLNGVNVPVVV